jgi:hypothetical protein
MKPPLRLNDKHRRAAQLMVEGMRLAEIGRQVGYNANYLSFLSHECPVFQQYVAECRKQAERAWATSLERQMLWPFVERWEGRRNRTRRRVG